MRVLITGSSGFVGGHLSRELLEQGHDVVPWDQRDGDLAMGGVALKAIQGARPTHVVHLAAQVGRVFGEDDPGHTIRQNATMTTLVAQACEVSRCSLLYASTSEVYGDQGDRVCHEDSGTTLPHNLYGLSKMWGEDACRLYARSWGLQVVRLSMPYGPGLPHGRGRAAIVNMLWQADTRRRITVHRGAERSWCWVGDAVRGVVLVMNSGDYGTDGESETYNVGNDGDPVTMLRVAEMACEITGAPASLIDEVEAPSNQTVVKRLGMDRLRGLGWTPTVSLRRGMEITYEAARSSWLAVR